MQPRGAEGEVGQGRKTHNLGSYLCSIYELSGAWHTMIHFQDPSLESEIILKNAWFDLKTTSNDIKKTTSFPGKLLFWTDSRYASIFHYIFSQYHSILLLREFYYWINKKRDHVENTQKKWFLILGGCPGNMECMHTFEIVLSSKCSVLRYFEIFGNTSNSSSNKGQPAFEISLR